VRNGPTYVALALWLNGPPCKWSGVDSSSELPAPIRFKPLYSHADTSTDLSIAHGTLDLASDHSEVPVLPVSTDEATHASPPNDVMARAQVLGVTAEPASISYHWMISVMHNP